MMHPDREKFKPYLLDKLGDVPVVMDTKNSIWDTCQRAWAEFDPTADYHVVIQDDALVCDDFKEKAEAFLDTVEPDQPVSFYLGYRGNLIRKIDESIERGYLEISRLHFGVAICLPTSMIKEMLEFGKNTKLPEHLDDTRIKAYLANKKKTVIYPVPSLIDHRCEISFVTGEAAPGRRAAYYIDRDE